MVRHLNRRLLSLMSAVSNRVENSFPPATEFHSSSEPPASCRRASSPGFRSPHEILHLGCVVEASNRNAWSGNHVIRSAMKLVLPYSDMPDFSGDSPCLADRCPEFRLPRRAGQRAKPSLLLGVLGEAGCRGLSGSQARTIVARFFLLHPFSCGTGPFSLLVPWQNLARNQGPLSSFVRPLRTGPASKVVASPACRRSPSEPRRRCRRPVMLPGWYAPPWQNVLEFRVSYGASGCQRNVQQLSPAG